MRHSSSFRSTISLFRSLYHHKFSTNTITNLPSLTKIPIKQRSQAIEQAQEVLTDYLHNTRALPFTYAEHISKNSTHSLSEIISKVPFSSPKFRKTLQKFLRYNPINEFGFFYESIGIDYVNVNGYLKPNVHFFVDDSTVLDAAICLTGFGFPWVKLGKLYIDEVSIFEKKPEFLNCRLDWLISLGFSNQQVAGICLVFPRVLKSEIDDQSSEFDALLDDLKRVFVSFNLESEIVGSVDTWSEVCRKVKVFYDLGLEEGKVGDLIIKSRSILTDYSENDLFEKVEFFSKLGVCKGEVGMLLLSNPKILEIELGDRVISVSSFLRHFGLREKKYQSVERNFKHVFGRNKMVNVPHIVRAMDLHEWFFHRMKCGHFKLFDSYQLSCPDDGFDENYEKGLESVKSIRTHSYSLSKLDFFLGIGFGENSFTPKLIVDAHGSAKDLQDRFNFLLNEGIEFSKLCKILRRAPKLLNQEVESLKNKIDFLRQEIGLSVDFLVASPSYLLYNLDKRIRPRYKFHQWLIEQGWCTRKYTVASIIGVSHKGFLAQLACIHPSAPQVWLERHGSKKQMKS